MVKSWPTKLLIPCWGSIHTDRKALSRIARCCRVLGVSETPVPIPVEDWIEGPLCIRLGFGDLSHLGPGVLGAAFVDGPEILIDEQVLANEGRCRFTCAHELGHLTLHAKLRQTFQDTHADVSYSEETLEWQADRFATAFLMPLPLLERLLVQVLSDEGLDRAKCVYQLMQPTAESEWLWRYKLLPIITERFAVSLSAAIYRCTSVQPQITDPRPLLHRSLRKRLLAPGRYTGYLASVHVVDGVPKYSGPFTSSQEGA